MTEKRLSPGILDIEYSPIYYNVKQIHDLVEAGFITWDQVSCIVHGPTKDVEGKNWWEVAGML